MENKMFVSKNDRSKWPARWEFDRSSPRSGPTLSVDRPLFSALGSCFDWSFWHHYCQSILVGIGGQKSQNNGLAKGTLFFSSPRLALHTRFALYAKCSIHLSWLLKRLLPRLPAPLSTRKIALLFKDLVHYVFVASGKVFTNNFRPFKFELLFYCLIRVSTLCQPPSVNFGMSNLCPTITHTYI